MTVTFAIGHKPLTHLSLQFAEHGGIEVTKSIILNSGIGTVAAVVALAATLFSPILILKFNS